MVGEKVCGSMTKANVCNVCGDAGFLDCLATCVQCYEYAEHAYCMATILETVPADWVCEECQQECAEVGNKLLACNGPPIQSYKKRLLSRVPSDFSSQKLSDNTYSEKLLLYEDTLENGAELAASDRTDKVGDGIVKESSCSGRANEVASKSSAQMVITRDDGSASTPQNLITEKLEKIINQITKDMRAAPGTKMPSFTPGFGQVASTTAKKEGGIKDFDTKLQVEEEVQGSGGALASSSCIVKNTFGDGVSGNPPLSRRAPPHSEGANDRTSEGRIRDDSASINECMPVMQGSSSSFAYRNITRVVKSRSCVVKRKHLTTAQRLSCGERAADKKAQHHIAKEDGDATASSRCISREWSKSTASIARASKVASAMRALLKHAASASQQRLPRSEEKMDVMSRANHHNEIKVLSHVTKEPHNAGTSNLTIPDAESTQADMPSTCGHGVDEPVNIGRPHANAEEISTRDSPTVSYVTVTESPPSNDISAKDGVACIQWDELPPHLLERSGGACVTRKTPRKSTYVEACGVNEADHTHSSDGGEATVGSSLLRRQPARYAASLPKVATGPGLNDGASTTSRVCRSYSSREAEDEFEFIGSSGSSFSKSLSLRPGDSHPSHLPSRRSNMMRSLSALGPKKTTKDKDGIATFKAKEELHGHYLGATDEVVKYGPSDRMGLTHLTSRATRAMKHDSTESPRFGHWGYKSGPFNRAVRCYSCNEVGHPAKLCQNVNVHRLQIEWRPSVHQRLGNRQFDVSCAKRPRSHPHDEFWERPLQRPFAGFSDPTEERKPWRAQARWGKEGRFRRNRCGKMVFPETLELVPEFQGEFGAETFVSSIRSGPSKPPEYVRGHRRQAVQSQDKVANFRALRAPGHPPQPPRSGKAFPYHGSHETGQDGGQRARFPTGPLSNQAFGQGGCQSILPVPLGLSSQSCYVNSSVNSAQERLAAPDLQVLWTGCFNISSKTKLHTCYTELQASASTKAHPKVFEALRAMPPELELQETRRGMESDTWPRSFKDSGPTSDSIGMYFFPKNYKHDDAWYKSLIQGLFTNDLVLRAAMEFAQLLIFPSQLLPEGEQRWFGRFFLWGIFRRKFTEPGYEVPRRPSLRDLGHELASSRGNGEVIDMDIDTDDAPLQSRGNSDPLFPPGFLMTAL